MVVGANRTHLLGAIEHCSQMFQHASHQLAAIVSILELETAKVFIEPKSKTKPVVKRLDKAATESASTPKKNKQRRLKSNAKVSNGFSKKK